MANKALSRLERVYVTMEDPAAYATAVAPAGTDAVRNIKLQMENDVKLLERQDKTGTRSRVAGVKGRFSGKWSFEASLVGSGSNAVLPPHDKFFQLLFGQAASGMTYTLSDNITVADIWSFRRPTTVEQRVGVGAVLDNFEFTLGQDIATFRCDGALSYVIGSTNFDTSLIKGGLGSFPAEPGTPTYVDAGIIAGFTGNITLAGQTITNFRSCTIKGKTGNVLTTDTFGSYNATGTEGDERQFSFSCSAYDDDSTAIGVIKAACESKAPVNATIQIGTVAGSIATFTLHGIQLASPTYDDSRRNYVLNIPDSPINGSDPTLRDEMSLAWS